MPTRDLGPLLRRRKEINATLAAGKGGGAPGSPSFLSLAALTDESAAIRKEIVSTLKAVPFPVYAAGSLLKLALDGDGYVECDLDGHPVGVTAKDRGQIRTHPYEGGFVRPVGAAKGVA